MDAHAALPSADELAATIPEVTPGHIPGHGGVQGAALVAGLEAAQCMTSSAPLGSRHQTG
jgi:hypothetical protein